MKLKKLMSLGLALVMAAALAVPALADDDDDETPTAPTLAAENADQQTTFTGGTKVATVKLAAVGTDRSFVFNPYKLRARMKTTGELNTGTAENTDLIVKDQIISIPFEIQNQTDVPLRMAVTFAAKGSLGDGAPGDATTLAIVKSAPDAKATAKQAYVYADFAAFDGSAAQLANRPDAWLTSQRLVATEATVGDDGWDGTSGAKIEIKNNTGGIYIPAPTTPKTPNGTDYQNSIWVKFGGAATPTPAENWNGYDTLSVYTAFKFVPQGTAPLYKLYEAHYTAGSNGADPTYEAGVTVGDTTAATGAPTLTVPYQNSGINVAISNPVASFPLYKTTAKEEQVDGNVEAGYVVTITPPKGDNGKVTHTIKSVTFYDADNTKLTAPKAATTNSKDKTAPWTFIMPAQNVVIDIVMESVSPSS